MIRLEALRTFVTVAEAGNIKDAATRLFRTPSAVSMSLSQLEEQLGGPLFETDRKSALSDLGRFVNEVAQVLVRDHDRAIELITAYAHNRAGKLRLATVPSVATHLLPKLLSGFVADRPEVEIDLVDTDSARVQQLVATGQADLGICGAPTTHPILDFTTLFRDPFRLICSETSPLAALDRPVRWEDLGEEELILNEASRVIPTPDYVERAARARLTMRNMTSLLAMVQAGVGVTLVPALACADLPQGIRALYLEDSRSQRTVGRITRAGIAQSPLAAAFGAHMDSEAPALLAGIGLAAHA